MLARILIVEDDIVVATDIRQLLTSVGYHVTGIASNYLKAIALFNENIPDLLICNVQLQPEDDFSTFLKETKKAGRVPAIYLADSSTAQSAGKLYNIVSDSFLIKPFSDSQMLVSVRRILYSTGKSDLFYKKIPSPTRREYEIIKCIANGYSSREMAELLSVSFETIQTHRKRIFKKYKVHSSAEIVMLAVRNNWLS